MADTLSLLDLAILLFVVGIAVVGVSLFTGSLAVYAALAQVGLTFIVAGAILFTGVALLW